MVYYKDTDNAKNGASMGHCRPDHDRSKSSAHNEQIRQAYDNAKKYDLLQ